MFGRRKILAALIAVVATVALGVSAYLTWVAWQSGAVAGCTADSLLDCDDVLASRWSKWFGLPVSLLGAITYLCILGLSLVGICWPAALRPQGMAMTGLFAAALIAAGAAVWFVGLQAIQLQSFCYYCLTVHACGLAVGVLAFLLFIDTSDLSDDDRMRSLLGVAAADPGDDIPNATSGVSGLRLLASLTVSAVGLAVLMGGQLLSSSTEAIPMEEIEFQPLAIEPVEGEVAETPTASELTAADDDDWLEQKSESSQTAETFAEEPAQTVGSLLGSGPRRVTFQALPEAVDVNSMPMMGSPQAEYVLVEMMDYTCKHCRHLHPHLRAAVEHYDGQLAVVIQHVPLSKKCNAAVRKDFPGKKFACDYAQLAIGVWKLAPEKFPEFHDWLLESEKPPNVTKARNRAMSLVGSEIFEKKIKADTSKRLAKQSAEMVRLKAGLPILLLTNGAMRGVPEDSQTLFDYFETKLGIESR